MTQLEQFRENFIKVAFRVMAELECNQTEFAAWLGYGRLTIFKILQRKQMPTVEQAISLCRRSGVDANWLLLSQGEMKLSAKLPPIPQPQS